MEREPGAAYRGAAARSDLYTGAAALADARATAAMFRSEERAARSGLRASPAETCIAATAARVAIAGVGVTSAEVAVTRAEV